MTIIFKNFLIEECKDVDRMEGDECKCKETFL